MRLCVLMIIKRLSVQRSVSLPPLNLCLPMNLQGEETKSGVCESELFSSLASIAELPNVCVRGFMNVPRPEADPAQQRPVFARLRDLLEDANSKGCELDTLSMGMTQDLEH